ncbi:EAL domain-containing protein [uncultured Roseobacter sp.]|uniref:bifunctional diguanylate cyclase/phosphodiesterase n=1 Tax=uncultured Roseobacter sp. TaxID=114847 RepID=UPI0026147F94|nr:EAL domain-containing protein [uncultured Roseobacter sp.]
MQRVNFMRRFLKLTLFGYILSILCVAGAVWFASAPTLKQMQLEAKQSHLQTKANVIAPILDGLVDEGEFLARSSDIADFVTGHETRSARAVSAMLTLQNTQNIRLLDFRGRVLLSALTESGNSPFLPVEAAEGIADMVSGRLPPSPRVSYRPGRGEHTAHFMIAIPILSLGQVEGLLVFERTVDLAHILTAAEGQPATVIATTFQKERWAEWFGLEGEMISTQMPGGDFHLIVDTDQKTLASLGFNLVMTAIGVAMLALIVPFSMMAASGMRAIVRPHAELEKSRETLAQQQSELAELAQIAEMAHECIFVTDAEARIIWANNAFKTVTGHDPAEIVGLRPAEFLHGPETDLATVKRISEAARRHQPVQAELLNYRKDGTPHWISLGISPLEATDATGQRFVSISTDITAAKEAQEKLAQAKAATEKQSLHDVLTGLPNRRCLDGILETEVTDVHPPRTLIRVDLDHFKNVNDTLGHAAGDFVLRSVADILRAGVQPGDIAARIGGDEFVILLEIGRGAEVAKTMTRKLLREIRKETQFEGKTCRVGASFGIATAMDGLLRNTDLLKSADSALYAAKEHGRNTATLYTPQLHSIVNEKRMLSAEIELGIKKSEFEAFFQPQFDARTGVLVGVEALVRWLHPTRGLLPPSQFLRVAEQLRLTPDIDRQVLEFGLSRIAQLNRQGYCVPKISFNMDVHQLVNMPIEDIVGCHDIGDTVVALEILESVLVEEQDQNFARRINHLRDSGFQIEVDDFGSGHASVIGLKHLQPHVMKLDRMLVQPVDKDMTGRALARNMIEMGKALGISVTAEGVETAEHAAIMTDLGCDTLQGFYFARPMPFEKLEAYVAAGFDAKLGQVTSFAVQKDARVEKD